MDNKPQLQRTPAIDAAMENMRTAQTRFEIERAAAVAARERANRIRSEAQGYAAAEVSARNDWREAFRSSDGVLSEQLKSKRKEMLDVAELADDYRRLLEDAEHDMQALELPALESARKVDECRSLVAKAMGNAELENAVKQCAPLLARAILLLKAARPQDGAVLNHTNDIDPGDTAMVAIKNAINAVDVDALDMPQAIMLRPDIAPLDWAQAASAIHIIQRKQAAARAAA